MVGSLFWVASANRRNHRTEETSRAMMNGEWEWFF
jgi:hypothetical protein